MHSSVDYCHFRGRRVYSPHWQVARFWWWWSWSFSAPWFTAGIVFCCYFTLGGCIGLEIRVVIVDVIVTGRYFTLGGCCSLTALTGLLIGGLSPCLMWMFLRCVSITVSHILTGAGTSPCLREYFSLGGYRSGKLQYFLQYFRLLYCLFHFGRVFRFGNKKCFWWRCCHSFELGVGPIVLLGGSFQIGGFL